MPLRRRSLGHVLLLIGAGAAASPTGAASQDAVTLRLEENFRREPNGVVLARVKPGTELRVLEVDGNWTRVELDAWIWLRSVRNSDDANFDLVVSAPDGENLRSGPSGVIVGRMEEGALLTELERDPGWAHVSRTGWMWTASLRGGVASGETGLAPGEPLARAPSGFTSVGDAGASILKAPDGDTLAIVSPQSDVEVVGREGNWARVRVEGWMWLPPTRPGAVSDSESAVTIEPADVMARPQAYVGRVVEWTLQFISLERAEAVRTDFFEGEPFLLTRFGGGDGPFIYVAVPGERLDAVEGLVPLEHISITGRIRTGGSALTGTPIVDLISIQRSRETP